MGKTKRGKGAKLMVIADASGLSAAARADSANTHEVKLVQAALDEIVRAGRPRRIIEDHAYDSVLLMKPLQVKELNSSPRAGRTARELQLKMADHSDGIKEDVKLNAFCVA